MIFNELEIKTIYDKELYIDQENTKKIQIIKKILYYDRSVK